jgi:hypothetical protein
MIIYRRLKLKNGWRNMPKIVDYDQYRDEFAFRSFFIISRDHHIKKIIQL